MGRRFCSNPYQEEYESPGLVDDSSAEQSFLQTSKGDNER